MKRVILRHLLEIFEWNLKRSSLIRRKKDWSQSKKETKLVALRDKKRKNTAQIVPAGPKRAHIFLIFFNL